ncbi:MAG: DUF3147 family protein [Methanoregula sp.]|jgi:uncharacterized membrane protein (GlpM family)
MDYLYLALKFIIGGSIVVGVTLLAEYVDPKYGAILVAAPIITTLAFLFTWSESGQATARQLVIGAFWFAIPTMLFILALYYLMARYPLVPSFSGAFGIWLVGIVVLNRVLAII